MSASNPPTPQDVLAKTASFLAPDLLQSEPRSFSAATAERVQPFDPPLDQWKLLVSQDAKGVGPYTVHRHETRFVMKCSFKGVQLESLYRLLTETNRRKEWDVKLEACRVVEVLQSHLSAVVEFYKLSGTFPIIKQRELVLLSCASTLPPTPDGCTRIMGGSTSIDHPDVPYSKSHMRFISSLSGYIFTSTPDGVELVQMQDFGPLANYVPSSALRLALTAILPKTLLSFKTGALKIPADGSHHFLPPPLKDPAPAASVVPAKSTSEVTEGQSQAKHGCPANKQQPPTALAASDSPDWLASQPEAGAAPEQVSYSTIPAASGGRDPPSPADKRTAPNKIIMPDRSEAFRTQGPSIQFDGADTRGRSAANGQGGVGPESDDIQRSSSSSWLRLRSPSLNATIDTRNKRLSYFETTTSSGAATPTDEQQKRLADILSTDEGRRALRRLSRAVASSDLVIEDGSSDVGGSTESLVPADVAKEEGLPQHHQQQTEEDKMMAELADAMGLQLNMCDDAPSSAKLLDVQPNSQEASSVGWANAVAGRALKAAAYSVSG